MRAPGSLLMLHTALKNSRCTGKLIFWSLSSAVRGSSAGRWITYFHLAINWPPLPV